MLTLEYIVDGKRYVNWECDGIVMGHEKRLVL
jgi:hypothetical protein